MKMPISQIVDHFTILKVKNHFNIDVKEEFNAFKEEIEKYDIPGSLIDQLYEINKQMFVLHDEIIKPEIEGEVRGEMALRLFQFNIQRVETRNKIAKLFKEPEEYKTYKNASNLSYNQS